MEAPSGNESPPLRTTILGSFLRGRPRNSSQSHIITTATTDIPETSPSPSPSQPQPPSPIVAGHRRSRAGPHQQQLPPPAVQPSVSQSATTSQGLAISQMLRRRRSAGALGRTGATPPAAATATAMTPPTPSPNPNPTPASAPGASGASHRIRLVPHIDSRRTLRFDAIARDLREGDPALRIGRFTDRSGLGLAAVNALGTNRLAFKSKVVSRAHAEVWVEAGGRFFIKDTKSSSGTFLNHVRLSPANTESRPYQMKDGDILQLGVDYQGGAEDIYKSVKIRIEVGREWQAGANAFNTNTLKVLKSLSVAPTKSLSPSSTHPTGKSPTTTPNKATSIPDCCICLFGVTIRQALFIAPCSHTFHYKCIRPLLESHHPAFSCPLCRTFADLEEDVEVEVEVEVEYEDEQEQEQEQEQGGEYGRGGEEESVGARTPDADGGGMEGEMEMDDVLVDVRGIDSEGSGSGDGDGPALVVVATELGEVGGGDEMDVDADGDGTVGVKRKR
ncbi:hypothetical protein H0H81_009749 [Sphagnurus paluster]|uniref:SMAD/FHA domain-containing protein n=1 Tax=Sphagnurus paluster TaxID=117069 RepID=A0A9P7GMB9_9AGAR|nr:hypothetical protein H0H81_009749 [Sphagnurus paluster]